MKLIYIANFRIPTMRAHGIQVMKMCEAFAKRGIEVELLIPRRFFEIGDDPFSYHQIERNFRIRKIPNLDTLQFPLGRIGSLITTVSFLFAAKFYLLFRKYDILYTREPLAGLFFKKFILEIHNLPERKGFLYKFILRKASFIVVITNFLKISIVKIGILENKILVLPDSVDLKEFDNNVSKEEARKRLNLPMNKKIIVYTGSFYIYDWKGVDVLLDSARYLSDDYLLVCIGISNEEEMRLAAGRYSAPNILLKYFVPHHSVIWYLKAADVLVLPNKANDKISEFHTSPLKLFEYMASRRPIVSSDLPSLREILTDREAMFFEAGNSKDLAGVINRIFQNENLSEKLSYNSYQKVKNYTWDKRADKIIGRIWISH